MGDIDAILFPSSTAPPALYLYVIYNLLVLSNLTLYFITIFFCSDTMSRRITHHRGSATEPVPPPLISS